MRGKWVVNGLINDFKSEVFINPTRLNVLVTKDNMGCTLSIGSDETGIMYSIPFDQILKEINRR